MQSSISKCLTDEIGFITKEHLEQYKQILAVGDVLSEYSRQLDSNCGAMTFAYLSVVGDPKNNDLIAESFKFFLKKNQELLREMDEKIKRIQKGTS